MKHGLFVLGFTLFGSARLALPQSTDYDHEMRELASRPLIQKAFQHIV